ncbi:hypothetical protein NC651_033771 [Populus alba x Populus x berolinensis]|nr:hypothetical protein NC651_033771 [Populus alba x Populus x berolinensis]
MHQHPRLKLRDFSKMELKTQEREAKKAKSAGGARFHEFIIGKKAMARLSAAAAADNPTSLTII